MTRTRRNLRPSAGDDRPCPSLDTGYCGYVVLHGRTAPQAVYRIRPDSGALRLLQRWPVGVAGRVE